MQRVISTVKKLVPVLVGTACTAAAVVAALFFHTRKRSSQTSDAAHRKAQKKREYVYDELKKSDSGTVVDSAYDAAELHAISAKCKQATFEAVQDRISKAGL